MTEIEAIRHVRHSGQFEPCLSMLTVAIGDIGRLSKVEPDQLERLWAAVARLGNAVAVHSND